MQRDLSDAYAALGLEPGAGADEVAAAYRTRAKSLHPDRSAEEDAADRMAAVNAAHDILTAAMLTGVAGADPGSGNAPVSTAAAANRPPGHWLTARLRRALGPELLGELAVGEDVLLVTPAATWASPRTVLAVTDRRLLWLLDDAVGRRVRWLRFTQLAEVRAGTRGRRRPSGVLLVRPRFGRKATFTELPVDLAETIADRVQEGMLPA